MSIKVEGVGAGEGGTAGGGDQSKNPFYYYNVYQPEPLKFRVPVTVTENEGLIALEPQEDQAPYKAGDMFICRRFPLDTDINRISVPGVGVCALLSVLKVR